METQASTETHQEHQQNPYDVLAATKSFNKAISTFENKERELGAERKTLGASIFNLENEVKNVKSEYSKAAIQKILSEKRKEVKEIEVNLDLVVSERNGMNISDFMGSGSRVPEPIEASNLKRSTMSDAQKLQIISQNGMDYYKKLLW